MRSTWRSWLQGLFGRARLERDLADEIAFPLQARTDHWIRAGLPPGEAARRARLEFGGVDRYKEDCRQARGLRWIDELRGDLRYAWRTLGAAPLFTLISVAILALGLGANIAVFSVIEAVMLRMLPVARPQELRELAWVAPEERPYPMSYDGSMRPDGDGGRIATSFPWPIYQHLRERTTTLSAVFGFAPTDLNVDAGRPQQVPGLLVSGTFLDGLGMTPQIGRGIRPDDDRLGADVVAMVSWRLWQRDLGGDPSILGRHMRVNGSTATIVGVLRPSFEGLEPGRPIDVLLPVATGWPILEGKPDRLSDAHFWGFRMMARVKPGIADEAVRVEAQALLQQALPAEIASAPAPTQPRLVLKPGGQGLDYLRRNYARPLYLLTAIMAGVLLVACANIAGLLLTRAAAREHEITLRLSLGAGRARIVRQLLTESVLLAVLGGLAGAGLAWLVRNSLLPALNQDQDPIEVTLGFSGRVLAFSIALCLAVGLICGLLPALRATRRGARLITGRAIHRGAAGASRIFAGKSLVVIQVAISLVLLVGAGLFTRSLLNLRAQALGFRPDHLLLFQLDASTAGYERVRLADFYQQVLARVAAMPGVTSAGFSRHGLLSGGATRDGIVVPGAPAGQREIHVHVHFVSPDYVRTMGIPLVAGRDVQLQDRETSPRVALVNQALAALLAGQGTPVGRQVIYGEPGSQPVEIVGLVGDARFSGVRQPAPPTIYVPFRQQRQHRMTYAVRVAGDPTSLVAPIRDAVAAIDPNVPMHAIRTQEEQIDMAFQQERVFAVVASGFGLLALVLACLGIYGTLAYSVTRRSAEIGVRLALGATRASVVRMFLRETLLPMSIGTAVGAAAAVAAGRVVESQLFGVEPGDATTIAATAAALALAALAAAWLPSRRAASIDPAIALRME
jgi:predicted permease